MRSAILFLSVLATAALADNSTSTYTFPAGWNIGLVDKGELNSWCSAQRNTCPQICQKGTKLNSCDSATLKFSCVCGDGSVPDVSKYLQTVPFYVCQDAFGQCINAHPDDADGQDVCKKAMNCGTKNASETTTTSSSSASASATLTTSTSADSSASATSVAASTPTNAAATLGDMTQYSTGVMAGLMFVAAGMVL